MKKVICVFLILCALTAALYGCSGDSGESDAGIGFVYDSHYSAMDESAVRAYEKLCAAVSAGESEVKFNTALLDDVSRLFYTGFPLNALVEKLELAADGSGVAVT